MSEDSAGFGGATPGNGEMDADALPVVGIISQYVKDFSFENPNAPAIFQSQSQPQIDVQFNIGAQQVGDDVHEVVLKIEARSQIDGKVAFVVDLSYAGLFAVRNIPAEHLQPFMLAEAPRLIFPFARRVLAGAVRDGGFPPLMLDPIDFGALYMQQAQGQLEGDGGTPVGHA